MDEKLTRFTSEIRTFFTDAKIMLFGSRAKGNARQDSDYDLIVVSEKFRKIPYIDRAAEVWRNSNTIIAADILCYAPGEVDKIAKNSVILTEALKTAVSI